MNIFLIYQDKNCNYDTFSSAVVIANTLEEAKLIHPDSNSRWSTEIDHWVRDNSDYHSDKSWANPASVNAVYLGVYDGIKPRKHGDVITSSFNAG